MIHKQSAQAEQAPQSSYFVRFALTLSKAPNTSPTGGASPTSSACIIAKPFILGFCPSFCIASQKQAQSPKKAPHAEAQASPQAKKGQKRSAQAPCACSASQAEAQASSTLALNTCAQFCAQFCACPFFAQLYAKTCIYMRSA